MKTLAAALKEQMEQRGLAGIPDAANAIGVTETSLRGVLFKQRQANSRTYPKYARFLRVSEISVREMAQANSHAPTSSRLKSVAGLGSRDLEDMVDSGVRAIQEAAITRVLGKIPITLIEAIRHFNQTELDELTKVVQGIATKRTTSGAITVQEVERRARRIRRQRLSSSRARKTK